ncbi:7972_t:CDS:2 [Paraglomus occultum]|uniref:7972_t:CDS:1 n=1 Tax=Paraglomus occultum TaxID=144539 RepID=A0A9N8VWW6_9GLOM|nr:7972_t:CDS:2 [Paraglomus occultum]
MNQEQPTVDSNDIGSNIRNSDKFFTDAGDIDNNIYNSSEAIDSFSPFSHSDNMSPTNENSAASPSPTEDDYSDDTVPETLPQLNDVVENNNEVETLSQHLIKHIWNNNFSAPVGRTLENGATVLDVGCGTGAWLLDMAETYSKSKFYGVDLLHAFGSQIPTNVTFVRGDILAGLPFPDNSFDFVTQRFLSMRFSDDEWKTKVINELVRVTKPGGWIELMECDIELVNCGNDTKRIIVALQHYLHSKHANERLAQELHEYLAANDELQQIGRETRDIESGGSTIIAQQARNDYGNFLMSIRDDLAQSMRMSDIHYSALWEVIHNEMKRLNTKRPTHRVFAQKKEL